MNDKNDRAINFIRFFFLGLAIALLILLGVLVFSIYRSSTRLITDAELVIVDDTEAVTQEETEEQTVTEAETDAMTEAVTEAVTVSAIESQTDAASYADVEIQTEATPDLTSEETVADTSAVQSVEGDIVVIEEETTAAEDSSSESTGVYSTLNAACNFRSEAGYEDDDGNDTTIGIYQAGTQVEVLEAAGGWTKVKIDGVVGYVGAQFVGEADTE
ncbi:MAG: hypothetical protein LIP10_10760 [Clostridiales bacterium]|nr:hypothetical protein [Clostridiales bacterium]